ncbi:hypothetical protein NA57DRAFT_77486 [Rhizodiscina lignyota]|uniref:Uncharacterized protein n=1 Tax=Rhizodiscina lignyota TaxID=1504668 RepID=A0A9P4IFF3_9PEZI|nr:hypothetical protein NA57DRAFT_77486 [Rhizodiscina lignyota]
MAKDASPRRSGRQRTANPKYIGTVSSISFVSDESDADEDVVARIQEKENEDDNFEIGEEQEEEDDEAVSGEEEDIVGSADEDEESADEDEESIVGLDESEDDTSVGSDSDTAQHLKRSTISKLGLSAENSNLLPSFDHRIKAPQVGARQYRRGIRDLSGKTERSKRFRHTWGTADEDLIPHIKGRDKWRHTVTLPSREVRGEFGGMAESFYHTPEMRNREMTEGWKWYDEDGGREKFTTEQRTRSISITDASAYLPQLSNDPQSFIMGPNNQQHLFSLDIACTMNISDAWDAASPTPSTPRDKKARKSGSRKGWILNAGAKIQCLEWVTNQHGPHQYLSVSVLYQIPHSRKDPSAERFQSDTAPAFAAAEPYPASMQIWRIQASDQRGSEDMMDMNCPPELDTVLCFDWGDVRQFKWCPAPRENVHPPDQRHLGLLASVWFDGCVRVLDVKLPPGGTEPRCFHISNSAFTSTIPDTIPTCLCWLSTMSIAVGCANGTVAIFHLPSTLNSQDSATPRPSFYACLHTSYINNIVSGYPSRPHIISTTSLDGWLRITDLRSPDVDFIVSARLKSGLQVLVWHDLSQYVLVPDDTAVFRSYAIRRAYGTEQSVRMSAMPVSVASSPVHPCIMVGLQDGNVVCFNPFLRALNVKGDLWKQVWFEWTWRRGVKQDSNRTAQSTPEEGPANGETATEENEQNDQAEVNRIGSSTHTAEPSAEGNAMDVDSPQTNKQQSTPKPASQTQMSPAQKALLEQPLGRFMEGHKLERVAGKNPEGIENTRQYHTIYEEATAICGVAWNPNLKYGGWAAAGTGTGLVRVEDIAIDRDYVWSDKGPRGRPGTFNTC